MSRIPDIVIARLNSSNCKVGDKFRVFHRSWKPEGHLIKIEEVSPAGAKCSGNTPNHLIGRPYFHPVNHWVDSVLGYRDKRHVGVFKPTEVDHA